MAKVKLVTRHGYEFWAESFLTVNGRDYPISDMTQEQRDWVFATRDVNGLNAAFAGRRVYRAVGLKPFAEVFPEIAAEMKLPQGTGA